MSTKASRRTRKRPASPEQSPARAVHRAHSPTHGTADADSVADRALQHLVQCLCLDGTYALLSTPPTGSALANSPLCLLSTDAHKATPVTAAGGHTVTWWGAALCHLCASDDGTTRAPFSLVCELSPLVLRLQPLTALTRALLALAQTSTPTHHVLPLTDDGQRDHLPWTTCRAAQQHLVSVRGGSACVALLHGLPRVQLEAFCTVLPASPTHMTGIADVATAARHWAALRPFIPPAFAALAAKPPQAWYLVRYPDGCPPCATDRDSLLPASWEDHMDAAWADRPYFLLPAALVVTTASLQVGTPSIPPAYRARATEVLAAVVAHARAVLTPLPLSLDGTSAQTIALRVRAARNNATATAPSIMLCSASSLAASI